MSSFVPRTLSEEYARAFDALGKVYMKRFAGAGLKIGAVVKNHEGEFRLTRITFLERPVLFGLKRRAGGEWSGVEYCVSVITGVEIVEAA